MTEKMKAERYLLAELEAQRLHITREMTTLPFSDQAQEKTTEPYGIAQKRGASIVRSQAPCAFPRALGTDPRVDIFPGIGSPHPACLLLPVTPPTTPTSLTLIHSLSLSFLHFFRYTDVSEKKRNPLSHIPTPLSICLSIHPYIHQSSAQRARIRRILITRVTYDAEGYCDA